MKKLLIVSVLALLAAPALADPVTTTTTRDGTKYDATRTVVRDKEAGTATRDTTVTRNSDGATATAHADRQRTDTGYHAEGTRTNFNGGTTTWQRDHTRGAAPASGARRRG
jgi:hypothetical protein